MTTTIRNAVTSDFDGWLDLAAEVADLFGSQMHTDPEFHGYARRAIENGKVFAAFHGDDLAAVGSVSFRKNEIAWFAVFARFRRLGIGSILLDRLLTVLDRTAPVFVTTFSASDPLGIAAHRFYGRRGFVDDSTTLAVHGVSRTRMRLDPS